MRPPRWLLYPAVVAAVAVGSHLAAVVASPMVVMGVAESRLSDEAGGRNQWFHAPRATPQNQQVVRTSPDLAYSACTWDLSDGPVRITAPGWDDYFSLSLYESRTDNFFVANDRTDPGGVEIVLATDNQADALSVSEGTRVVRAPTETGVALLRYLAPTADSFERVDQIRRGAVCGAA